MSAEFIWTELPSADVAARLRQLDREGAPAASGFLDIHQWLPLANDSRLAIHGGHQNAQFRLAALGTMPEVAHYHILPELLPDNAKGARGVRAWLDRQGLPPNSIGDIAAGSHICLAAIPGTLDMLPRLEAQEANGWVEPEIAVERVTVAGERLDALLAGVFRVSRSEAQTAIKHGFVYRNFAPVQKRTQGFEADDQIIFRTKGRAQIAATGVNPRSGRLWVEFKRYPV